MGFNSEFKELKWVVEMV